MEISNEDDKQDLNSSPKPVLLLLLDGWGVAPAGEANAFSLAKTPFILKLITEYPTFILPATLGSLNNRYLTLGTGTNTLTEDQFIYSDLTTVLATSKAKQLKIFDSERLAALSYFFNGRREEKAEFEDWLTITSADKQKSYDVYVSAKKIFQEATKAVKEEKYDFIVAACSILDYLASNTDLKTTVLAVEFLDKLLKKLSAEILDKDGVLIVTSTHGNAEKMTDFAVDLPDTKITNNPVPGIIVSNNFKGFSLGAKDALNGDLSLLDPIGTLANLAPTIIDILKIDDEKKTYFPEASFIS